MASRVRYMHDLFLHGSESRLRERRLEKQAKKNARKQASQNQPTQPTDVPSAEDR